MTDCQTDRDSHDQETYEGEQHKDHFCGRRIGGAAVARRIEIGHHRHLPGCEERRSQSVCNGATLAEFFAVRHAGDIEKQESKDDDALDRNVWNDVDEYLCGHVKSFAERCVHGCTFVRSVAAQWRTLDCKATAWQCHSHWNAFR